MAIKLPAFAVLAKNYPMGIIENVKQEIGGAVDENWITNTCTIRVSKSLNYAGNPKFEIPRTQTMYTVKGADKKNYAIRVAEFNHFLRDRYGPPQVIRSGDDISIQPFLKKTGIINWHVSGWSDATGHFTLWNDDKGLYEGHERYFDFPIKKPEAGAWLTKVELWQC